MKALRLFLVLILVATGCKRQQPHSGNQGTAKSLQNQLLSSKDENTNTQFEWPRFHGSQLDNLSRETGLLKQWPSDGPKLLWTAKGIGEGFSTVAIADVLIYTTGNIGKDTIITTLDLDGSLKWTAKNGPAYKREQPGTRATPTIDNGRLYHENADGDVVCLDANTGDTIWSMNILEKFNGRMSRWGLAEALLIDGNNVICTPGGVNAGIAALDKNTGQTVWICEEISDKPGYCSPVIFEYKGLRQIVTMMAQSIIGVNAANGKLLWQVRHITPYDENINMPIYSDGRIFVSTQVTGSRLLRLKVDGELVTVKQIWDSEQLESQHGGVLLLGNYLYGACRFNSLGPWVCLDIRTGKRMYAERGIGTGSLTYADGMLYVLNHKGTVALVPATPRAFEIVSQFTIPRGGRGPTWAHPVVCSGRLYIRHGDFLYCYDIKNK